MARRYLRPLRQAEDNYVRDAMARIRAAAGDPDAEIVLQDHAKDAAHAEFLIDAAETPTRLDAAERALRNAHLKAYRALRVLDAWRIDHARGEILAEDGEGH